MKFFFQKTNLTAVDTSEEKSQWPGESIKLIKKASVNKMKKMNGYGHQ